MRKKNVYSVSTRGPADHDVRDQIIAAATERFSRYGYEKTTVSDLANEIGFSKAYIYKFFASKQVIGEMICANCLSEIEAEIRAAVDAANSPAPVSMAMAGRAAAGLVARRVDRGPRAL